MAIGQFTEITLSNRSQKTLSIENVNLSWGKIYPERKKNGDEIPPGSVNNTQIAPGKNYVFRSCGRSDASSGTEGTFDLFTDDATVHVRSIYWSSPWGLSANIFTVSGGDDN
jgi:hypothetical protein